MLEIVAEEGNRARIALRGKVDTMTSSQLGQHLDGLGNDEIAAATIDMAECDFISSAGLRVVIAAQKRAVSNGGNITFLNVRPDVMEVFSMIGFDRILKFG